MSATEEKRYRIVHLGTTKARYLREGELPLVFSYGAGVHSFALLVMLLTNPTWRDLRRRLAMIIHADLGAERPETTWHLHHVAIPLLRRHGYDLTLIRPRVRAKDGRIYEDIYDYYMAQAAIPTRANLSCTTRFKIRPCQQATADLVGDAVTIIGYHAGESHRPRRLPQRILAQRLFPLMDAGLDHDGCVRVIAEAGYPVPIKSACHFCMNSKVREMEELCELHPVLMERNIALEENMHTQRGRSDITLLSLPMRRIRDRYWERRAKGQVPEYKRVG